MESSRHLIRVMVELASRVKLGKNDLKRALAFFRMDIDRDASAIVLDRADLAIRPILKEDLYGIAVSSHSLIDRVVNNLIDKMVKPVYSCGSYIHSRSQAHRLESLENRDAAGIIILARLDLSL